MPEISIVPAEPAGAQPAAPPPATVIAPVVALAPIPPDPADAATRRILWFGTIMSGVLALACIVGAMILCCLILSYVDSDAPDMLALRLLMSCLACFIAMGFGCLGFGLFLIRARGELRAESTGSGPEPKGVLQSNAPGLIVIVCATVIVWLALRVKFTTEVTGPGQHLTTTGAVATGGAPAAQPAQRDAAAEGVVMP